jgi:hypothetical protein
MRKREKKVSKRGEYAKMLEEVEEIIKRTPSLQRRLYREHPSDIALHLMEIETLLRKGIDGTKVRSGLDGGSYRYTPVSEKLKTWVASDGSRFKATTASILLEYADYYTSDDEPGRYVKYGKHMDQASWEGR